MSRNDEIREILRCREVAERQRRWLKFKYLTRKRKAKLDPENLWVSDATWPGSKR